MGSETTVGVHERLLLCSRSNGTWLNVLKNIKSLSFSSELPYITLSLMYNPVFVRNSPLKQSSSV